MAGQAGARRTSFHPDLPQPYVVDNFEFNFRPLWKNETFLTQKYLVDGRSITQIALEYLSSRATVRKALIDFGIKRRQPGKPGLRPAQAAYGYRMSNGLMVRHEAEQKVISVVERMNRKGMSLREICDFLTSIGIPTKRRGQRWHPEMINRILKRSGNIRSPDKNE